MFPDLTFISEYYLDSVEGGTILTKRATRPAGPLLQRMLAGVLTPVFSRFLQRAFETFGREIEGDYRAHGGALERETELSNKQIREAAGESLRTNV